MKTPMSLSICNIIMVSLVTLVITQSNPRFILWPVFAPRQNINFQFEFTLIVKCIYGTEVGDLISEKFGVHESHKFIISVYFMYLGCGCDTVGWSIRLK